MKRAVVGGVMAVLALSAALSVLAQAPPAMDRRPPGMARPVGPKPGGPKPGGPSGGGTMPGRPGGGGPLPGKPPGGGGGRPTPGGPGHGSGGHHPTPSRPGHRPHPWPGHRPPSHPGYRPPNRPIYGWNHHRYRAGPFRYPAGFGYRRWAVGQSLPSLLFSAAYFFTDYAVLGLDSPPYGYQWVRYGPDVMLVNIRTGEVLDVINNAFY